MNKRNAIALLIGIAVGAAIIVIDYADRRLSEQQAAGLPVVEVRIDTVWIHDTVRTAGPVVVREEVRQVPASVDTAAILAAFYTERTLTDSFHLRDVATVRITDTLFLNDIVGRRVDYELATLVPTAAVVAEGASTRQIQPCRLALSVGTQLGSAQAAVMAGLRYRRAELGVGYDLRLRAPSIILKYDIAQWP